MSQPFSGDKNGSELVARLRMLAKLYAPDADTPRSMIEAAEAIENLAKAYVAEWEELVKERQSGVEPVGFFIQRDGCYVNVSDRIAVDDPTGCILYREAKSAPTAEGHSDLAGLIERLDRRQYDGGDGFGPSRPVPDEDCREAARLLRRLDAATTAYGNEVQRGAELAEELRKYEDSTMASAGASLMPPDDMTNDPEPLG